MQPSDSHETAQENVGRPTLLFGFIPLVPLAFLGLGIYRAWIEIAFVGSFTGLPAHAQNIFGGSLGVRDLFDGSMVAASFACALFAKQIGPFFDKKPIYAISSLLLVLSTVLVFSTRFFPESSLFLGSFAAVAGGVGIAFLILLWSELYGCLNPLRVATYYSLSIVVGAIVVYIWHGFMFPWLFVMTALLPLVSILCVYESFRQLPSEERPQNTKVRLSIPWKAIILMSIYAFAYGLLENTTYSGYFGPHSAPGTLAAGAVVFFAVAAQGRHFDFGMTYRLALPFTVAALLLIPAFNILSEPVSSFCVSAGYTAQSILVMVIIANLCYRYGASAILLFGIERGVRQISMIAGRAVNDQAHLLGNNGEVFLAALTVVAVMTATLIIMSERELSSSWGITVDKTNPGETSPVARKHELSSRVADVSREHKLSAREEEVLLLLAQHKTVGSIERELFIANGTAKAHVRHIYQKLDIHTRQELFDMLGVVDNERVR